MGGQARKPAGKKSTGRSSSATTTTDEDLGPQRHQPKSKSSYSGTKSTRSKQTTSTKDSGFLDIAFQNGILNPICSKPPATLESHQERIDRSRETASPSESDYRHFASAIRRAPNEASVLIETSVLLKRYDEPGYQRSYNQAFSNFPKNVGFNNDLSAAQPDMVEGLDMPEFDPFPVREQLGGAATVYSGPQATTLPHLAGEWKGPGKDMILAQTQAGYDGACMVYSRNKARLFLKSPDPTGHAFVSTFTTDGTTLNTFAHYSSESQGQVKYHQYPTSSSFLVSSYPDFKRSRRRLRNLQDDAKETSEKLRDELMEKWLVNQRLDEDEGDEGQESYELVLPAASASTPAENADFANSNGYDYDHGEDPNDQLLTEYWTSFSANHQDESLMPIPTAGNVYTQPSASFQENNPDECLVQIPVGDSVSSLPYASIPANNQDDPSMQIFTSDNGYTSPDALITPPQSSKDTSLPLEAREDIENSNVHGHRRTRRTRTRTADPLEGPREIDHKPNGRKTRRKHYD